MYTKKNLREHKFGSDMHIEQTYKQTFAFIVDLQHLQYLFKFFLKKTNVRIYVCFTNTCVKIEMIM